MDADDTSRRRQRVRILPSIVPVLFVSLQIVACSDSSAVTRELELPESDVPVVRNTGHGAWSASEAWRAEVGLRLGGIEAETDQQFGRISALAVDSAGRLLVVDGMTEQIKVFSADGTPLCTMSREGQGPGEILYATGLATYSGDTVWIRDNRNRRYSAFSTCGGFERMLPVRMDAGMFGTLFHDGRVGLVEWTTRMYDWGRVRRRYEIGSTREFRPVAIDVATGSIDSFPPIVRKVEVISERAPAPFTGTLRFTATGRGTFWFADSDRYLPAAASTA